MVDFQLVFVSVFLLILSFLNRFCSFLIFLSVCLCLFLLSLIYLYFLFFYLCFSFSFLSAFHFFVYLFMFLSTFITLFLLSRFFSCLCLFPIFVTRIFCIFPFRNYSFSLFGVKHFISTVFSDFCSFIFIVSFDVFVAVLLSSCCLSIRLFVCTCFVHVTILCTCHVFVVYVQCCLMYL